MRVLHVIPSISEVHGGPSKAIFLMERALRAAGVEITTVTTDDHGPGLRLTPGQKLQRSNDVTRVYVRKWFEPYKFSPGILIWLFFNIKRFDIVHIHALFSFTSVVAGIYARIFRISYIIRPLGSLSRFGITERRPRLKSLFLRFIDGPLLRNASAVHFTSQLEWDDAQTLGIPFHGVIIPLGIEKPAVDYDGEINRYYPGIAGRRVVLFLGRLDPIKNIESLIRASTQIDWSSLNAVLLIAGEGKEKYTLKLKNLAKDLNVDRNIIWAGQVSGVLKTAALAEARLFVLPSFSENFGVAVVEALLAGVPCVLGAGVGIAPEIGAAGAGMIVDPTPSDLADAISALLSDGRKLSQMALKAKDFAESQYSVDIMADRIVGLYEELAKRSALSP